MISSRPFAVAAILSLAALTGVSCGGSAGGTASNTSGGSGGSGAGNGSGGNGGNVNLGGNGSGTGGNGTAGNNGSGGAGGNGYCGSSLTGTLRDFQQSHPDFEYTISDDKGIVENLLANDHKPAYAHGSQPTTTVHSQTTFDQWYHDVPNVNKKIPYTINLTQAGGNVYTYDNPAFFPIDNQGWGNEGNNHNFHFTFEIHTKFVYNGGEVFTFTGDDDLWTFINGKLAIDLGGVHGAETDSVDLDAQAGALGLTKGGTYSLEVFSAERHTTESHFRIDTTIASFVDCGGTIQ